MDNNLLNDRISQLKAWEQKESLNEILFNALSTLSAYTQERFDELTREIRDESVLNREAPVIKVAVCEEDYLEKQLFLFPVSQNPPIESPGYLTTVFAEIDYYTITEMMRHTFQAEIKGKTGTHQVKVALSYSAKYLQKLESLYYVFSENNLPWTTANGIYFYKFLDVYCINAPAGIMQEINKIKSIEIDFAHFEKYISYNKTLLWNISPITAAVAACEAKPAYNMVQFEHKLKNLQLDENRYLVCSLGGNFSCFRHGQMMHIRTYTKQMEQFDLLRINSNEDANSPLYLPIKSNQKKAGFIENLSKGSFVPTRGEAERIIDSLSSKTDLLLLDIKILPPSEENIQRYKGVDMNYFLESNSLLADKKIMLFSFKTAADPLWAYETMFFILSELQLRFYEYRCVGEMI